MLSFEELAQNLQEELAIVDLLSVASSPSGNISLMVKQLEPMALRMSPDNNHFRAHLHIDYGKEKRHAASFAVDTGELLAGSVRNSKHHKTVEGWIGKNRAELLSLWSELRNGRDSTELVPRLKAN